MFYKVFGVLLLNVVANTHIINSTRFSKDIYILSNPNSFSSHLLSLVEKNETRYISSNCLEHLTEYAKSLLGFQAWALEMFDASEKLPAGFLQGNGGGLGEFDQCIGLKQDTPVGTIKGKYCLGALKLVDFKDHSTRYKTSLTQQRLINLKDFEIGFPWGICLPDSCLTEDFRYVTLKLFQYSESFCQTLKSEVTEFDAGDYSAITLLSFIGAVVIISTVLHPIFKYTNRSSTNTRYFSFIENVQSITDNKIDENEITCLYGLRSITLFFLTLALKFIMYPLYALTNWISLVDWVLNRYLMMTLDAAVAIDTFLVISGTLVSYNYLKNKQKGAKFNLILYYLNRIIRITPALAVTVLIASTIMRHFGSGPIWPYVRNLFIVDSCRKYWWSSLLYVQNYNNPGFTDICILPTWYLSVDMQLIILSPILLIPLGKMPKYTVRFILFVLLCSIVSPFIATRIYNLRAILIYNVHPVELNRYMRHFGFPLHTRASSWIIGFLLGYVLHETKQKSNRLLLEKIFSPLIVTTLWILSLGLMTLCICLGLAYFDKQYNWVANALHLALVRPCWSLAISWIIFACEHGYSGPVNTILSASIFRIIAKVSYCTFLVNIIVLIVLTHQTRRGLTLSWFNLFSIVWSDIVWSLIFGLLLSVTFERPFIMIFKRFYKTYDRTLKEKNNFQIENIKHQ